MITMAYMNQHAKLLGYMNSENNHVLDVGTGLALVQPHFAHLSSDICCILEDTRLVTMSSVSSMFFATRDMSYSSLESVHVVIERFNFLSPGS